MVQKLLDELTRGGTLKMQEYGKAKIYYANQVCMDIDTWVWMRGCGYMGMGTWIWVHGYGYVDMDTWIWIHDLWIDGYGYTGLDIKMWAHMGVDTKTWIWVHGHRLMDIESAKTKSYPE